MNYNFKTIIITALILAAGIFIYIKLNQGKQERERLQQDRALIQKTLEEQDQRAADKNPGAF
jgi:uncharacterized membrane protein YczE